MTSESLSTDAIGSFSQVLKELSTQHRKLHELSELHTVDLSNYIFGSIIWPRLLGRPSTPDLREGISVALEEETEKLAEDDGESPAAIVKLRTASRIDTWENSDPNHYILHFVSRIPSCTRLAVCVSIVPGIYWLDDAGRAVAGPHAVTPSYHSFDKAHPVPNVIEPFTIVGPTVLKTYLRAEASRQPATK